MCGRFGMQGRRKLGNDRAVWVERYYTAGKAQEMRRANRNGASVLILVGGTVGLSRCEIAPTGVAHSAAICLHPSINLCIWERTESSSVVVERRSSSEILMFSCRL